MQVLNQSLLPQDQIKCEKCGSTDILISNDLGNQCITCAKEASVYAGVLCAQITNELGKHRMEIHILKTDPQLPKMLDLYVTKVGHQNMIFFTQTFLPPDTIKLQ